MFRSVRNAGLWSIGGDQGTEDEDGEVRTNECPREKDG